MYTCRKCNENLEDSDRYCYNCGAYIGEPTKKKDNWEEANSPQNYNIESWVTITENESETAITKSSKAINNNLKKLGSLLNIAINDAAVLLDNMQLKVSIFMTIITFLVISLLFACLVRWSFDIPNDLRNVIVPFDLLSNNLNLILNIPASFSKVFVYSLLGIFFTSTILFVGLYFAAKIILRTSLEALKLWNSLILSYMPYALSLVLLLLIGFISKGVAAIVFYTGIILCILNFSHYLNIVLNKNNKSIFITVGAILLNYLTSYIYMLLFLTRG